MRQLVPDIQVEDDEHEPGPLDADPTEVASSGRNPADGPIFYDAQHQCLCYLLLLETPKVRSTPTRRLRLKESLYGGAASHNAGILAKDPQFWDYLQQVNLIAFDGEIDARRARHFITRVCGVTGRHALDRDPHAGQRFFRYVEKPFLAWLFAATVF